MASKSDFFFVALGQGVSGADDEHAGRENRTGYEAQIRGPGAQVGGWGRRGRERTGWLSSAKPNTHNTTS